MAKPPAVVIIARHGPRLDAADQNWHLSTPTPYDPPLTYGGWNQSKALGVRIASLLHAREQSYEHSANAPDHASGGSRKRKRRKHKVVIHSSPFLRCVQTGVAIAAGMAQFQAPAEQRAASAMKARTPNQMHSASPRLRAMDGSMSPTLLPIPEPKHDLAHELARKALSEHKRHRKTKMRVDAFLGEWLNPQYYDQITPPPPSAMMVATAKAELMQQDTIDVFIPSSTSKGSMGSLWGGKVNGQTHVRGLSHESVLEDWSDGHDALPAPAHRRDRASSVSSVGSNDSGSGRKSPFRFSHGAQALSLMPKHETTAYHPPTPSYSVSTSDNIPKGYVSHARNACVNVDYQWDSSRSLQDWGDGGEYGEEWSSMHKRFRRGLNHMMEWYSQHNADDRGEDALGFDQAERHLDDDWEEQEDLVVILVTHGAGSNALIGALTGQPVLLDVGMASLTMAVRKEDSPSTLHHKAVPDLGLGALYDMKLVSSSEHLRPGANLSKPPVSTMSAVAAPTVDKNSHQIPFRPTLGSSPITTSWNDGEERRSNTSAALGTIRRPSSNNVAAPATGVFRASTMPLDASDPDTQVPTTAPATAAPWTGGLWTPPSKQEPALDVQKIKEERRQIFGSLNDKPAVIQKGTPSDGSTSSTSSSPRSSSPLSSLGTNAQKSTQTALDGIAEETPAAYTAVPAPATKPASEVLISELLTKQRAPSLSAMGENPPAALGRTLSQKGLWGSKPKGSNPHRNWDEGPKRRWSMAQE